MELGMFPSLSGHGNLHKMSFFFPLGEVFFWGMKCSMFNEAERYYPEMSDFAD